MRTARAVPVALRRCRLSAFDHLPTDTLELAVATYSPPVCTVPLRRRSLRPRECSEAFSRGDGLCC